MTKKGGFRREPWFPFQLGKNRSKTDFPRKMTKLTKVDIRDNGFKRGLSSPLFLSGNVDEIHYLDMCQ